MRDRDRKSHARSVTVLGDGDYTLRFRFDIECGEGMHPVLFSLSAWGTVEATTPCDLLPEAARRLAGSHCRQEINSLQQMLLYQLQQYLWGDQKNREEILSVIKSLRRSPQFFGGGCIPVSSLPLPERLAIQVEAIMAHWGERLKEIAETAFSGGLNEQEITHERLRTCLTADDSRLRWAATVMAGIRQASSLVPALLERTEDGHFGIQVAAIWALTEIGDAPAVATLRQWLLDERLIVQLRTKIVAALGHVGDSQAVELLVEALKSENRDMQRAAAQALGRTRHPLAIQALVQALKNDHVKENAARALVRIGTPALRPLVKSLDYGPVSDVLLQIGAPAIKPLTEVLMHWEWNIETKATLALAGVGDPQAISALIAILKRSDRFLRDRARAALVHAGAPAVQPLIDRLSDEDWRVRQKAAQALGEIGDHRAVEPLREALKDAAWQVRWQAIESLIQLGEPRVELLMEGFSDKHRSVRAEAAVGLSSKKMLRSINDAALIPALVQALKHWADEVRAQARKALAQMGASAIEPLIEVLGDKDEGWKVAGVLAQIGEPAVVPLIERLKHKYVYTRRNAARALGRIGDRRAIEPLREACDDLDPSVRQAAWKALKRMSITDSEGER